MIFIECTLQVILIECSLQVILIGLIIQVILIECSLQVICIRDGNAGQLIIDDLTGQEERAPGVDQSWRVQSPLYVGGAPLGHAQKNIQVCLS